MRIFKIKTVKPKVHDVLQTAVTVEPKDRNKEEKSQE